MTPEEIKKMQDDNARLTNELAAEKKGRADDKAAAEKTIKEKDDLIEQKNQDLVGIRKENTKLKDLTAEEKAKMSEKEIELHNATLALQKDQEAFQKQQQEAQQKEVDARKERAIAKIAGKDPELAQKVRDAYGKIVDADKAQTEEEIAAIATSAFNMLGVPRPNPVNDVMNGGDGAPGGEQGDNFAETTEGKALAEAMGLPTEVPAEQK